MPGLLDSQPAPEKRDLGFLPPILIGLFVVGLLVLGYREYMVEKPSATGTVATVVAVELPSKDRVLVAVKLHLKSIAGESQVVHSVAVRMQVAGKEYKDFPSSAFEVPRYLAAYPDLKSAEATPLAVDTKLPPGAEQDAMIAVAFPVNKAAFDSRSSLQVQVNFREHRPLIMREQK